LDSLSVGKPPNKSRTAQAPKEATDLEWPPQEEEFLITLDEGGWTLGSVQAYDQDNHSISVQFLTPLKTRQRLSRKNKLGISNGRTT